MDPSSLEASNFTNGYNFGEESSIPASDPNPNQYATNWDHVYQQYGTLLDTDPLGIGFAANTQGSVEDTDFSETVKFISQILMEENVEQRPFYDSLSLQVTEKSFHDALLDKKPLSPNQHPFDLQSHDSGTTTTTSNSSQDTPSPDTPVSVLVDDHASSSQVPPYSTSDGLIDLDSSITNLLAQNIFSDVDSVSQFNRGVEEASKFLPPGPSLVTGLESSSSSFNKGSRKNHKREEGDDDSKEEGGRSNKQSAVGGVVDEGELSEMFDRVLLNVDHLPLCKGHDCLQNGPVNVKTEQQQQTQTPSSDGGKTRPKRSQGRSKNKETIDLRTLLLPCSQAVYANDNRTANELLKQIKQHSSPFGDASQRLAHYFANGLEARLIGDGTGAQTFYSSPSSKKISAAEFLKAYQVHLSTSPFKKFAYFFANKMIMKTAAKAETLHIIDFGILYGFQWPLLIKFLSDREGGPPKLRITGIEFPLPGFRPTERIEETGRRLANYCKRFNVQFEYNAIASRNWETIRVEDLKIKSDEVVAVNCLMRFKNLLDETIEVNSPRDAVLRLIRKINPDIFAHSIVNGSYNAPFFATRFREAMFHFSAIYDMCDTVIPRENEWRMMIEREIVGREAMNVIACEGLERVERPETYKQWQVRNTRAGFKQLPLHQELMAKFRTKLREGYHRDFVFDEDNNWMLQGWKGRILYASTCWVPA